MKRKMQGEDGLRLDKKATDLKKAARFYRLGDGKECLLAAKALEALAWQAEKGAKVVQWGAEWRCSYGEKIRVHADTPLGALLAAMDGEA